MNTTRVIACCVFGCISLLAGCSGSRDAEVSKQIDWSPGNKWMIADLHAHTEFSDGSLSVAELTKQARLNGCDAFAITDHSDVAAAGSAAYFDAIEAARRDIKSLVLLAGLEWNIPPYGGREHVSLLMLPRSERRLSEFRPMFEGSESSAAAAFDWLAAGAHGKTDTIAIYNHPSRKVDSLEESGADFIAWSKQHRFLIGFEGGPGHMKNKNLGSYKKTFKTIDHWDPVVAEVGGVWDALLNQGVESFGALASSDYHNSKLDYGPCTFAKLHLLVPERTAEGVFAALRAGAFWAGHGDVVESIRFDLMTAGLIIPAIAGEVVELDAGAPYSVSVAVERGADFAAAPLVLELIGDTATGTPALVERHVLSAADDSMSWTYDGLDPAQTTAYVRLRIRLERADGPDYLAYTNPIRLRAR